MLEPARRWRAIEEICSERMETTGDKTETPEVQLVGVVVGGVLEHLKE